MAENLIEEINLSRIVLIQNMTLEERYKSVVDEAVRVTGAQHGTIFLNINDEFKRVYSDVPRGRQFKPRKEGLTKETFESGHAKVVTSEILKQSHPIFYKKGVESLILIPLEAHEQKIGVLSLQFDKPQSYDKLKMDALNLFGTLVALAIQNSQFWEKVENSMKARDLFISLASHELRTPLTTIMAYAGMLERKIKAKQNISDSTINVILAETKRLKNIIDELLEFDQIMSGQLKYRWQDVNLNDVIKRSIINFKATYPEYKTVVENKLPKKDGVIQGDPDKLQQVFSNMLINAAKFSSPFTPILIEMKKNNENVYVSFNDYGKGMRKTDQKKIFNEFFKGTENRMPGMGLGLYLVKKIVEKHKGTVEVFSKLHKGTKFTVKLPARLYGTET